MWMFTSLMVEILAHTPGMIAGVVLAAGLSTRMGTPKATLPLDPRNPAGDTFLTGIIRSF